jgi:hypothetical protein
MSAVESSEAPAFTIVAVPNWRPTDAAIRSLAALLLDLARKRLAERADCDPHSSSKPAARRTAKTRSRPSRRA